MSRIFIGASPSKKPRKKRRNLSLNDSDDKRIKKELLRTLQLLRAFKRFVPDVSFFCLKNLDLLQLILNQVCVKAILL